MNDVLIPLLIFGAPERQRDEITERLLPVAVPGSIGQRLAFTAIVAQQQIAIREQAELNMVKEAAARFEDADDLSANAPTLYGVYAALPANVQATIEFDTDSVEDEVERKQEKEIVQAAKKEREKEKGFERAMEEQTPGRKA